MSRPFERLRKEVLVDNQWHRYCRDLYVQADTSEGSYYYIDIPGSAATIPLFADGSTVLIEVYRYLLGRRLWEFPIGGVGRDEDPLSAAQRELEEEAGLVAQEWEPLGRFAPYKGASNEICYFYLARGLSWRRQKLEAGEQITVHRMPLAEARTRLLDQDVGDGQSWGGLILLDRWLRQHGVE